MQTLERVSATFTIYFPDVLTRSCAPSKQQYLYQLASLDFIWSCMAFSPPPLKCIDDNYVRLQAFF